MSLNCYSNFEQHKPIQKPYCFLQAATDDKNKLQASQKILRTRIFNFGKTNSSKAFNSFFFFFFSSLQPKKKKSGRVKKIHKPGFPLMLFSHLENPISPDSPLPPSPPFFSKSKIK